MNSYSTSPLGFSHDAIAARAREIWHARNCPIGQDEEIWFEAERQLAAEVPTRSAPVTRRRSGTGDIDIDERELSDRLDDFGDPGTRSATSVDPTR